MKKGLKISLWIVCILLQAVLVIFGTLFFYDYTKAKQRIEELEQEPYFTKYELTADEVELYMEYYGGFTRPSWEKQLYIPHWPDYSYYEICGTSGEAGRKSGALNYWLFFEENNLPQEIKDMVSTYGFSEKNYIDETWVFYEEKKALELAIAMEGIGKDLKNQESVYEAYINFINECAVTVGARTQIENILNVCIGTN